MSIPTFFPNRARSCRVSSWCALLLACVGFTGCAVALVPQTESPRAARLADGREEGAIEPTSRWTISIRPDAEEEASPNAAAAEPEREAALPVAHEPASLASARPVAPAASSLETDIATEASETAEPHEAPRTSEPVQVEIAREEPSPTVATSVSPSVEPPVPSPLPTYVSPRAKAPEARQDGKRYVIEPPAYGGGEPRDPADTASDALDPEYRVGVEDLLDVSVLGEADLQHLALRVSPRGTVDFPYAGTLTAAGLTVDEFRNALVEKLADYYVAPQLTVFLREYRSRMVHVLGEVPRPGPFKLTHRNTLMEVLSRAGGFTPLANKSDVQVIRQDSAGKRVIRVDVNAIIDDGQLDLDIPLEAGDVINVPERIF